MTGEVSRRVGFLKRKELLKTLMVLAFVVLAEYAVFFGLKVAFRTEYLPFHPVSSESMVPTLNVGDLIVVRGVDPASVTVGTVIVFHSPRNYDMLIVHRVVGISTQGEKLYFETKGDNNPTKDGWYPYPGVPEGNLVGIVIGKIAYVGYVILALKEPIGMTMIVLLTAFVIIYEFILPAVGKHSKLSAEGFSSKPSGTKI